MNILGSNTRDDSKVFLLLYFPPNCGYVYFDDFSGFYCIFAFGTLHLQISSNAAQKFVEI